LGTIRAQLERDGPIEGLCLVVAAWIRYCLGRDEQGREYAVDDPLAPRFAGIAAETPRDAAALVERFLEVREVFGGDLPGNARFRAQVTDALHDLLAHGAAAAVGARATRR